MVPPRKWEAKAQKPDLPDGTGVTDYIGGNTVGQRFGFRMGAKWLEAK